MVKKKETLANLILLLVAAIWGGGFIAGKMALTGLSPATILLYRYGMGASLCCIFFWKRIVKTPKDIILKGVLIGIVQIIGQTIQLVGLQYTSSANQSFLCSAYVAFVPFISWIMLKKRPGLKAFAAGIIALTGIGFISLQGTLVIGLGDGLSVLFSVIFGVQIVLVGKLVNKDVDVAGLSFFQLATVAVISLIVCVIRGELSMDFGGEALAGVLYLGLLNTFVAFTGQNWAQKYAKDTVAALLMSLESLFGFVFSVVYYKEVITIKFLLGSALCFAAVLMNTIDKRES